MRTRPLFLISAAILTLSLGLTLGTESVLAIDEPTTDELVFITASGTHYHRESCRHAKKAWAVPLSTARERGLTPCAICFGQRTVKTEPAQAVHRIMARVVGITDGDTVKVLEGKTEYTLRLNGIDAPESRQAFGIRAKEYLSSLIFGKVLRVELLEKDRYGRWVANIFDGGSWVNKAVIEAGYAWHYRDFSTSRELQAAENRARAAGRGLWLERSPQAPWDWRRDRR